jgi:putative transposase
MKREQFSSERIIPILRQAEKGEQAVGVLCREHGMAAVTFYR